MKKEIIVYTISDSLGETSQKLLGAASAQYPDISFLNRYNFSFVTTEEELLEILKDALKDKALVVSTLVSKQLITAAKEFSERTGLLYLDLMAPFFELIQAKAGVDPIEEPGRRHQLDRAYFDKISAIEFAVKYDDGKNPQGFLDSDILLLGVSRTSKTPVSMYLANQGYRVSNLPLIPEVPLPPILEEMDPQKMIGLVCSPETLGQIRSSRLASLGLGNETSYTNVERIEQELAYAEEIFAKYGIPVIDVTAKSVEETAFLIKEKLDERN